MQSGSQRVIVINGVRYNVAIRLDTNWSYVAEWWNNSEYHKHTLDESVPSTSKAEREAVDQVRKAHLKQEPWLHLEMAGTLRPDVQTALRPTTFEGAEFSVSLSTSHHQDSNSHEKPRDEEPGCDRTLPLILHPALYSEMEGRPPSRWPGE